MIEVFLDRQGLHENNIYEIEIRLTEEDIKKLLEGAPEKCKLRKGWGDYRCTIQIWGFDKEKV